MATRLNPYLAFRSSAREAMEFYRSVFGGKLDMQTFKEFGMAQNPGEGDKIMHAQLETDNGLVLMAADTPEGNDYLPGTNVSLSLSGENEQELRGYWDKLCQGGKVSMPLEKAPWGDVFGMCMDRYGTQWMVNITQPRG